MSLIFESESGWLIDDEMLINKWYEKCHLTSTGVINNNKTIKSEATFHIQPDLFNINSPFMMESQFEKLQKLEKCVDESNTINGTRKRRRKKLVIEEDGVGSEKNRVISKAFLEIKERAMELNYFTKDLVKDNNGRARYLADTLKGPGDSLQTRVELHKDGDINPMVLQIIDSKTDVKVNQVIEYAEEYSTELKLFGEKYLIPPRCKFLLSDWKQLLQLHSVDKVKYDLIVIDPPWKNKSVKRKRSYNTLWEDTLLDLPVPNLANPGCLIVIWVTNKTRLHSFIEDTLTKKWRLQQCVKWHWLKITRDGEMICDINSNKKPYETLYIGRCINIPIKEYTTLPNHRTIISIPCSLHSKKPSLAEILQPYLPENPKCLELFARNLHPNWTSWGNEVLKHQHLDFFNVT